MSICEWTTFERISRPSSTTAAEVSSQEDSIPRIFIRAFGRRPAAGGLVFGRLRILLEQPGLDLRTPLLDLGLEDLQRRLELEVPEAVRRGGLFAFHDPLVAPE